MARVWLSLPSVVLFLMLIHFSVNLLTTIILRLLGHLFSLLRIHLLFLFFTRIIHIFIYSYYSSFSAFLSGSKTSCQFIQYFSYHNQLIPHCFTVFHKDGSFIVFLVPLMHGDSICNVGNSMYL